MGVRPFCHFTLAPKVTHITSEPERKLLKDGTQKRGHIHHQNKNISTRQKHPSFLYISPLSSSTSSNLLTLMERKRQADYKTFSEM